MTPILVGGEVAKTEAGTARRLKVKALIWGIDGGVVEDDSRDSAVRRTDRDVHTGTEPIARGRGGRDDD
jgi:hypothetical protein